MGDSSDGDSGCLFNAIMGDMKVCIDWPSIYCTTAELLPVFGEMWNLFSLFSDFCVVVKLSFTYLDPKNSFSRADNGSDVGRFLGESLEVLQCR